VFLTVIFFYFLSKIEDIILCRCETRKEVTDMVCCDFIVKNMIVKNINSLIFGGKARSLPLREFPHVA
jgi:hypothetical protein